MKRSLLSLAVLIGLLTPALWAQPPLADRVPADPVIYLGWAGRTDAFDESAFGQMVTGERAGEIVAAIRQAILSQVDAGDERQVAEQVIALVQTAVQHPIALAVMAPSPDAALPIPDAALMIDLGDDRAEFLRRLEAVLSAAGVQTQPVTAGGVEFQSVQLGQGAPVISFAAIDDLFVVTLGEGMPERVATGGGGLMEGEAFTRAYRQVSGENEQIVFYADVERIRDIAMGFIEDQEPADAAEARRVIAAFGLDRATAVVGVTRVVDGGMYSHTRLLSPAPHRGLLALVSQEPLAEADFAALPADADFAVALRISPQELLEHLRRTLESVDPRARQEMEEALDEMSEELGVSLERDLLANLGDRITIVSAPSLGGFLTGTVATVRVRDAQALRRAAARLERRLEEQFEPGPRQEWEEPWQYENRIRRTPRLLATEAAGTEIHYVQFAGDVPLAPAWAISDDQLVIALWPQVVQAVLERPDGQSLAQSEDFRGLMGRLQSRPSMVCYANWPSIVRTAYGLPLVGWAAGSGALQRELRGEDDMPAVRMDWLPPLAAIQQALWPAISSAAADEQGLTFEYYGSLPVFPVIGNVGTGQTMGVAILLPALSRARAQAKMAMSAANLNAIGKGVYLYMSEHDDRTPESLDVLLAERTLGSPQTLVSPLSGQRYVYFQQAPGTDQDVIVAYDDPRYHGQRQTPVLYFGGYVLTRPVDQQFWDQVQRARETALNEPETDGAGTPAGEPEW